MEVEHSTFTPIVLSTKGVMGKECEIFHKALAHQIATKTDERYDEMTRLIRVKLSFIVLKAALLCIRGSRVLNSDPLTSCEDYSYSLNELRLG